MKALIPDLFCNEVEFKNLHGYDDIKDVVRRAIEAKDSYNLLFVGPPASAKTFSARDFGIQKRGLF